jgi:hypothetical protein
MILGDPLVHEELRGKVEEIIDALDDRGEEGRGVMGKAVPDVGVLPSRERSPRQSADGDGDEDRHNGRGATAGDGASGHAVGFVGWIAAASPGGSTKAPLP